MIVWRITIIIIFCVSTLSLNCLLLRLKESTLPAGCGWVGSGDHPPPHQILPQQEGIMYNYIIIIIIIYYIYECKVI